MSATEQTKAAHAIADAAPFMALREPFPPSLVGKLPRAGVTLDFVGHGAVTRRLLEVDPWWNWEPCGTDEHGEPWFVRDGGGNPVRLWIFLTVLGVTRRGVGTCPANQFDAEKVLIGDALRNAAMRFGVALDLWIKGQAEDDERHTNGRTSEPARSERPVCPVCSEPLTGKAKPLGDGTFVHEACFHAPADKETT